MHLNPSAKWLLGTGLGFSVALAVFAWITIGQMKESVRDRTGVEQRAQIGAVAASLDQEMLQRMEALSNFSRGLGAAEWESREAIHRFLEAQPAIQSLFPYSLAIVAASGDFLAQGGAHPFGRSFAEGEERAFLREVIGGSVVRMSEPRRNTTDQSPYLMVGMPVRDRAGFARAAVIGRIDLVEDPTFQLLSSLRLGTNGYFYLVHRCGTFVFHPKPGRTGAAIPARGVNRFFDRVMDGFEGSGETVNSRGEAQLLSAKWLDHVPWALCGVIPLEEAYALPQLMKRSFFWAVGTILAITFALFVLFGMRLRREEKHSEKLVKETREILIQSEERFRLVFEHSPFAIALLDQDLNLETANPATFRMFGIEPAEARKFDVRYVLPDESQFQKARQERLATGTFEGVLFFRRADGSTFPGRLRTFHIPQSSAGHRIGVILEDVSMRERFDDYHMLFHVAVDAFAILDLKGRVEQANPAFAALVGIAPAQCHDRVLLDFIHPEDSPMAARSLEEAASLGRFVHDLKVRRTEGGGERILSITFSPDLAAGKIYAVVRDVTQREASLAELARQGRFLEIMERTARLGLWEWERARGAFRTSAGLKLLFGLNADSSLGREEMEKFLSPGSRAQVERAEESVGSGGEAVEWEGDGITVEGKPLWLRFFLTATGSGERLRILCVVQENSPQRRAAQILEESEARFRELFRNLTTGFALHSMHYHPDGRPADYRTLLVNPAYERMTGIPAEKLLTQGALSLFPQVDATMLESFSRVVRTGNAQTFLSFEKANGRHYRVHAFRTREGQFGALYEDLTDQIREETVSRHLQQRLAIVLHSIQAVVMEMDPDFRVRWISMQAQRAFGHPLEAWTTPAFWEQQIDLADRPRVKEECRLGIRGAVPFSLEYRFRRLDGASVWVRHNATPVWEQGRLEGLRSVLIDIHQEKLIEIAHRENETRLKSILDSMGEGLAYLDPEGRIMEVNRAGERIFGMPREDLLHKPSRSPQWSILGPDGHELAPHENPYLLAIRERRATEDLVLRVRVREESPRWISVNTVPVLGADGRFAASLHTFRDITRRVEAEGKLRELEARHRQSLDLIQVLVVSLDTNGKIALANRFCAEVAGVPEESLVGRDFFFDFVPESDRERLRLLFQSIVEGRLKLFSSFESEICARDGSRRIIAWRTVAVHDASGAITGTMSAGVDVTEARAAALERGAIALAYERELMSRRDGIQRAREIQWRLNREALPVHPHLDLQAAYWPAEEVSGDFVRFFPLSGGRVAVVLADCTGHGIEASMMAVLLYAFCESFIPIVDGTGNPAEYLSRLNDRICSMDMDGQFPVMTVAVFHSVSGKVAWAHANGEPLAILGKEGVRLLPRAKGMHLGFDRQTRYETLTAGLAEGETLLLYSDALLAVSNAPLPSAESTTQFLGKLTDITPGAVLGEVHKRFMAGEDHGTRDDLTLVAMRRATPYEAFWSHPGGEAGRWGKGAEESRRVDGRAPEEEVIHSLRERGWPEQDRDAIVEMLRMALGRSSPAPAQVHVQFDAQTATLRWKGGSRAGLPSAAWSVEDPSGVAVYRRSRTQQKTALWD